MKKLNLETFFHFSDYGTNGKREILAGVVGYFTIVYILIVNSLILSEAGIPINGAVIATILLSALSCVMIGLWANVPILLVPGMGVNALFAYTMVQGMGLSWQSALGAVFISGVIFVIIAFTKYSKIISDSIPSSIKEAISVGLGLFLMLIGLEKGGIITGGSSSIVALGDLSDPAVCATVLTFLLAITLFIKNVPGNFMITILAGSLIAYWFGTVQLSEIHLSGINTASYGDLFFSLSFLEANRIEFWISVFAMTMVLVFENIGLVHGHVDSINRQDAYKKSLQATSVSVLLSGLFGSSPTVATVETAAGIASGGRTGLTSVVTGVLFILSLLFIPVIKVIPDSAIAPILIIIGILMLGNIKKLNFSDLTESIPAIMIITIIPFTYSIADGMAFGFILYPFLKLVTGKAREVSAPMYVSAGMFIVYFIIGMIG
ncbi:NCS2 family permease [Peribacillus castrilensis]|uniref:Xanthine/uracil permease family protein n=1 Tax=Peribacillus simplex TaxID=1478 RepID=A0AAN2PKE8_9BACI|nr:MULTISPECIES: NCS2 family permease [Bacillaceae]MCP1093975.1 NCS2 family permease [Bacillaceae bacterium OS4b]MCF7623033.1 NCS2 family permease [Peribacillus frigoritolerans]MCP1153590.1 NCS2 family permease [Peribacillus frigoritolerans]MCT1389187.1 NCS2 family permease [Peribacillus frigoritolerans]MEA3574325.1 NCS2 family permease [Peribacillus frigoritolerans]